jgi:hypothetical protein
VGLVLDVDEPEECARQLLPVRRGVSEQRRRTSVVVPSMDNAQPARADRVRTCDAGEYGESCRDARHLDAILFVEDQVGNFEECLRGAKAHAGTSDVAGRVRSRLGIGCLCRRPDRQSTRLRELYAIALDLGEQGLVRLRRVSPFVEGEINDLQRVAGPPLDELA